MRVAVCMTRWNHQDKAKGAAGHIWHRGVRASVLMLALLALPVHGACPGFLDQEMRRLHSSESVNLCKVVAERPVLIVNTASHCGFTGQFKGLEARNSMKTMWLELHPLGLSTAHLLLKMGMVSQMLQLQ